MNCRLVTQYLKANEERLSALKHPAPLTLTQFVACHLRFM
jgi:hypothetical protein